VSEQIAKPSGVHLVGGIPLASADEVMHVLSEQLGGHLRRMPDGETGARALWISFQLGRLSQLPFFELRPPVGPDVPPTLGLKEGYDAGEVDFGDLGYADAAIESYATFARLQADGTIPADIRFQFALPTPLANSWAWMGTDPNFAVLSERYEAVYLGELARICDAIPHDKLAIQWDVCVEVWTWEGWIPVPFDEPRKPVCEAMARISAAVPDDVELGYHLCYGDWQHEHMKQPQDTANLVELVNRFLEGVDRPVAYLHIPVPIERDDDAYFEPLRDLRIPDGAELYLGLVHYRDGVEGAQRRIDTAQRYFPQFGVATECGMSRRPPERGGAPDTLRELLGYHTAVSDPVR
jgi:hypothetical protein